MVPRLVNKLPTFAEQEVLTNILLDFIQSQLNPDTQFIWD
jgi:hypothetical protein